MWVSYFFPVHCGKSFSAYSQLSTRCDTPTWRTVMVMSCGSLKKRQIRQLSPTKRRFEEVSYCLASVDWKLYPRIIAGIELVPQNHVYVTEGNDSPSYPLKVYAVFMGLLESSHPWEKFIFTSSMNELCIASVSLFPFSLFLGLAQTFTPTLCKNNALNHALDTSIEHYLSRTAMILGSRLFVKGPIAKYDMIY